MRFPCFPSFSLLDEISFSLFLHFTCKLFFLQVNGIKMRRWLEIDFLVKHFAIIFDCVSLVLMLRCGL